MANIEKYSADHRMRDLIEDNNLMIMVISRFGLSLGFGNDTVGQVCASRGIDAKTFLAVANFISEKPWSLDDVDLQTLLGYLKNAHTYFLNFLLPMIRRKLVESLSFDDASEVTLLILKFFDKYVREVDAHMSFENDNIFGLIEQLSAGNKPERRTIRAYASHHDHVTSRLKDLKDIIIGYLPPRNGDLMNSVLYDIITCEQDLISHCRIENSMMIPLAIALEESVVASEENGDDDTNGSSIPDPDELSPREKEILACVARGLANKEIADELCLSVHTVTTHRRNISAKLQIHSPAALAVYAIANHLIDISDIKSLR
jgi:regulator of cell morphogenesis and NO signaling